MKSKSSNVFLGAFLCEKCGLLSSHNAVPEIKDLTAVYVITGVPAYHTVMRVTCSHCGYRHKLKGEWKDYYKQALKNHFDNDYTVSRFVEKIKEIARRHSVIIDGNLDEHNLDKAVDEIYRTCAIEYGYDRVFYYALCELYSFDDAAKEKQKDIMFKSYGKAEKQDSINEDKNREVKQEKSHPLFKSF